MLTVFQGETGGTLEFSLDAVVNTAVSGYLDVVTPNRIMYRFDGLIASGNLYIAKSGLGLLPAAEGYIGLPQAIDAANRIYFLEPQDLCIIGVPGFFSYAVLTPGNSILVRLLSLESISAGYETFTAGASGVQTSKFLAFNGATVHHADCRDALDAGALVGIAIESAGPGESVQVQNIGLHISPLFPFSVTGQVMLGYDGGVTTTVPANTAFIQYLGVVESPQRILLFIDSIATIL